MSKSEENKQLVLDSWRAVYGRLNTDGTLLLLHESARRMKRQGTGGDIALHVGDPRQERRGWPQKIRPRERQEPLDRTGLYVVTPRPRAASR